ncbi:MAG TPA: hypothetical protein VF601_23420 [Beijerinckiaceae bacterium]|jgi:hypothetical protein
MFSPDGAKDIVRKTTSDPKKLKAIAEALGVDDPGGIKSAKVELTRGGGGSKSSSKTSGKTSGKGR